MLKKLAPLLPVIVGGWVAYKIALIAYTGAQKAMMAIDFISFLYKTIKGVKGLEAATKGAAAAQTLLNTAQGAGGAAGKVGGVLSTAGKTGAGLGVALGAQFAIATGVGIAGYKVGKYGTEQLNKKGWTTSMAGMGAPAYLQGQMNTAEINQRKTATGTITPMFDTAQALKDLQASSKTQTEIAIRVIADPGTQAMLTKVDKKQGDAKIGVQTNNGNTMPIQFPSYK